MKKTSRPRRKTIKETGTAYRVTSRARRGVKTDVVIPAPVRVAAQQLAQRLDISLSELYTSALTAYIAAHQTEHVAESRQFGSAKGLIVMADDFDEPLLDFNEYQS